MEQRLRSLLTNHNAMLESMAVTEQASQQSFILQLSEMVSSLADSSSLFVGEPLKEKRTSEMDIKIVSVDLDAEDIHRLINQEATSQADLADYIQGIGGLRVTTRHLSGDEVKEHETEENNDENTKISRCISKTHVTMVHCCQTSQRQMRERFAEFLGKKVNVTVSGIHFSPSVAALDVTDIQPDGIDTSKNPFPQCANSYPHVTVWCSSRVKPYESNNLPQQLRDGVARRVEFHEPVILHGTLSFWKVT